MRSMKPATPGNRATFFMKQMTKEGNIWRQRDKNPDSGNDTKRVHPHHRRNDGRMPGDDG